MSFALSLLFSSLVLSDQSLLKQVNCIVSAKSIWGPSWEIPSHSQFSLFVFPTTTQNGLNQK